MTNDVLLSMGSTPYFVLFAYEQAKIRRLRRAGRRTWPMKWLRNFTVFYGVLLVALNAAAMSVPLQPSLIREKNAIGVLIASICLLVSSLKAYKAKKDARLTRKMGWVIFHTIIAALMVLAMIALCTELVLAVL